MRRARPLFIFLLFFGMALLLRFFSFFPSVINHDESTYIVISDTLLAGYTYQVDYIDTKPIGIFLVYAMFQLLLGKSILLLRIAAAATLALTAFFLYRAKRSFGSNASAAFAAGLIYLFLNSIFTFYGVSPNTETFFNLFTALALWIYCSRQPAWAYFLAGLSLGLGFMIKYVVLFDGLAFGLFLLWQAGQGERRWGAAFGRALLMAVGAALPFLGVLAYYQHIGHLEEFWFYTFTASSRYPSGEAPLEYLLFFLDFHLRFLPVTVFFYYALFHWAVPGPAKQLGLLWSILVLLAVMLPGKFFGHYFIQFMLPFSFLAGEFFGIAQKQLPRYLRWLRNPRIGYPLLTLLLAANLFFQYQDYYLKKDYPRQVAHYLQPRLSPADVVYTAKDQITYHLLGKLPPIPYVHPSAFWEEKHQRAMEVPHEEILRELKAQRPRFLIFRDSSYQDRFEDILQQDYELVKEFDERVGVYWLIR